MEGGLFVHEDKRKHTAHKTSQVHEPNLQQALTKPLNDAF